jgi:hypothetical protein
VDIEKHREIWSWRYKLQGIKKLSSDKIMQLPDKRKKIFLEKWENEVVWNENKQNNDQKLLNICNLPDEVEFAGVHWIMDRLKEAMGQYVRGEWFSSIIICGAIVEMVIDDLWKIYSFFQKISSGENRSDSVKRDLKKLNKWNLIDEDDFARLYTTRHLRDQHIHLRRLRQDVNSLKCDCLTAINNIVEFVQHNNMKKKYFQYININIIDSNREIDKNFLLEVEDKIKKSSKK